MENVQVRDYFDKNRPYCFELYSTLGANEMIKACKTDAEGRVIEGNDKNLITFDLN